MVRSLLIVLLAVYALQRRLSSSLADCLWIREIALAARAIFSRPSASSVTAPIWKIPKAASGSARPRAVAANPEMVIRWSPDESELWELVRRGEMPPADASAGPLSQQEKELIRSWIAAGARHWKSCATGDSGPCCPARQRRTIVSSMTGAWRRCR